MAGPKSLVHVAKPKRRSYDLFVQGHARAPYKWTWEDMMSTDCESDSESEIAVSGGHAPQPAAKKIKSCACSVALGACMPLCNVCIGECEAGTTSSWGRKIKARHRSTV